jgi:hypothetical protein
MNVIHPPVLPNRRINWDAWVAAGTVVPPRHEPPGRLGGVLVVLLIVGLIFSPMLLGGWR